MNLTADETGKRKRKFRTLGTEPFDETEHGLQTVNVVEAEDGAKLVGIRKLFKKKEEDGSIKTLPRRGKSFFIPLPKLTVGRKTVFSAIDSGIASLITIF